MLVIPRHIYRRMIEHARNGFPLEICGILGGRGDDVAEIYQMTNADASHEHFRMEPREQFAVVKDLRSKGLEMLALYHSHPTTPARPSEEDVRLALTPDVSHVIISLANLCTPDIRSFKIANGRVSHEELKIIPE